jgi:hypothetical protein
MAKKRKPKATGPEVAERVAEVLRIRLDGAALHDVVEYAKEKKWNVSERQLARYLEAADALVVERLEKKRKRVIGLHLARRETLYARCVNAADYRSALAVLTDLAKLQGLYATDRELKELVKLATAQAERLAELEKRLAAAGPSASPIAEQRPPA